MQTALPSLTFQPWQHNLELSPAIGSSWSLIGKEQSEVKAGRAGLRSEILSYIDMRFAGTSAIIPDLIVG